MLLATRRCPRAAGGPSGGGPRRSRRAPASSTGTTWLRARRRPSPCREPPRPPTLATWRGKKDANGRPLSIPRQPPERPFSRFAPGGGKNRSIVCTCASSSRLDLIHPGYPSIPDTHVCSYNFHFQEIVYIQFSVNKQFKDYHTKN